MQMSFSFLKIHTAFEKQYERRILFSCWMESKVMSACSS